MARHATELREEIGESLVYLPSYKILVCKPCKFAIQPNALSSHLQKHKLFRSERRQLLERISMHSLVAPSHVTSPPTSSPAFQDLVLHDGFKCQVGGCDYACISEKRMDQHWSQVHNCSNHREVQARRARLQTFFRGTQIRYFEVESLAVQPDRLHHHQQQELQIVDHGFSSMRSLDSEVPALLTPASSTTPVNRSSTIPSENSEDYIVTQPNLRAMMYLHHFTVATGDSICLGMESPVFWTQEAPREALRYPYLMYGILGLAACHKASLSGDSLNPLVEDDRAGEVQEHWRAARHYHSLLLPSFRRDLVKPTAKNSTALAATARCLGIQDTLLSRVELSQARDAGEQTDARQAIATLVQFLTLILGSCDTLFTLQETIPGSSGMHLPVEIMDLIKKFASRATRFGGCVPLSMEESQQQQMSIASYQLSSTRLPVRVYESITSLPLKLATATTTGSVKDEDLAMATQCANVLLETVRESLEAPTVFHWRAWVMAQCWTQSVAVKEHLLPALRANRPAAVVMLAYFCVHVVRKVENLYWFTADHGTGLLRSCKIALTGYDELIAMVDEVVSEFV